jgi:hypothetical protein
MVDNYTANRADGAVAFRKGGRDIMCMQTVAALGGNITQEALDALDDSTRARLEIKAETYNLRQATENYDTITEDEEGEGVTERGFDAFRSAFNSGAGKDAGDTATYRMFHNPDLDAEAKVASMEAVRGWATDLGEDRLAARIEDPGMAAQYAPQIIGAMLERRLRA